ncbi:bifunctional oligoribonuclease/PAP phosphatase NrnA [candidate division KSB1 bacterium]|nr:bifunctional oligoribonuclease/PAP phosphatase NrnA [candidate division KSB1 bacterium]
MHQTIWDQIRSFIKDKDSFLITTHQNPDGDAIGSQVALAHFLRQLDKTVYMINCDSTPRFFQFLDPNNQILIYDREKHFDLLKRIKGGFIVDISDWKRLADLGIDLQKLGMSLAVIDHHIPTDQIGDIQISDQHASSTGEIVYDLLQAFQAELTMPIMEALYTCLLTDTGSFCFSNTTAKTLRIASDLVQRGAPFRKIYLQVYESQSISRARLLGKLYSGLEFDCDGKLAWFNITQSLLKETGADRWEAEGFSEIPRTIDGVQVSLLFSESDNGHTKVSFRSKGKFAVNELAGEFGGGGHKFAAGAKIDLPPTEAIPRVLARAKMLFE